MDWDKLRIFHTVGEVGSFTHAGESLHLSQSAVSRQISALEESLNTRLFHRHARGLILTEQGELLHQTVKEVFGKLALTETRIKDSKDRPAGDLRITATMTLGSMWLAPLMENFAKLYPQIEIHMLLQDEELDLSMREADVAIRLWPPRQPDLIQRMIFQAHVHIYASRSYIEENGQPEDLADLDNHKIITFGEGALMPIPSLNWLVTAGLKAGERRRPFLTINNVFGIFQAMRAGAGIAMLPDYMIADRPDIVRVLPSVEGPQIDAYFVYPEELRSSKKITVFRDFLLEQIPKTSF